MNCDECNSEIEPGWLHAAAKGLCISCDIWRRNVEQARDGQTIVIDGHAYRDDGRKSGPYRGFGGREFKIERDGQVFTCADLGHLGTIPERFRNRLPDNARWADSAGKKWVMYSDGTQCLGDLGE